jgi:hypothetical protein
MITKNDKYVVPDTISDEDRDNNVYCIWLQ